MDMSKDVVEALQKKGLEVHRIDSPNAYIEGRMIESVSRKIPLTDGRRLLYALMDKMHYNVFYLYDAVTGDEYDPRTGKEQEFLILRGHGVT